MNKLSRKKPHSIDQKMGIIITNLRKELQMTQKQLAEAIKIKQPQLSLIEKGGYPLRISQIIQITQELNLHPSFFFIVLYDMLINHDMNILTIAEYTTLSQQLDEEIISARETNINEQIEKLKKRMKKLSQ